MFPFILFPLIAGIIAIAGYRYLAKRQPEYPNTRVILTFALFGGALGGLLMALFDALADALAGIVVVSLDFVLIVAMLLACGVIGAITAAILSALVLPKAQ